VIRAHRPNGARGDRRETSDPGFERSGSALYSRLPYLVLALIAASLVGLGQAGVYPDSWLSLVSGRELLQHGFTATNGWTRWGSREWVDQQWGAHLAFYGAWQLAGAFGLVALNIVLITSGFALCLRAAAGRGGDPARTGLLLALAFFASNSDLSIVRAQSFSILCFGLLVWILMRDDGRLERGVFLAIPLIAVWANLHPAMLVGAAVCAVYAVACLVEPARPAYALHRRALALMLGAGLACLATPVIAGLPWYLRQTMSNPDFRIHLPEWQPTTLASSPLFVLGAFAALAVTAFAPIPRRDKLLVWTLTILGFTAIRSELWACLIWLVVLPGALERLRPVRAGRWRRRAAVALGALVFPAVAVATAHDVRSGPTQLAARWPRAAAAVVTSDLQRDRSLRVFADQPLADWLLFVAPAVRGRLAIDGRFEVFDHETFEDVFGLSEHPIRITRRVASEDLYVLSPLPGDDGALVRVLERDPAIVEQYRSASVVIMRRELRQSARR
jgi:hypothetical protein